MKKYLIFMLVILIIVFAACDADDFETTEGEYTQTPTSTPQNTPEATDALQKTEEVSSDEIIEEEVEETIKNNLDELPEWAKYNEEEQSVTMKHQTLGEITYHNISQAGVNEYGYVVLRSKDDRQEVWLSSDYNRDIFDLIVVDLEAKSYFPGKFLDTYPTFSDIETELGFEAANEQWVLNGIVDGTFDISWLAECDMEFSDALKQYLEKRQENYVDIEEIMTEEVKHLTRLFMGEQPNSIYPSIRIGGMAIPYSSMTLTETEKGVMGDLIRGGIWEVFPDYDYSNYYIGAGYEYILKNCTEEDQYKYINQYRDICKKYITFTNDPSPRRYYDLQCALYDEDTAIAPVVIFGLMVDTTSLAPSDEINETINYNGEELDVLTLVKEIKDQAEKIADDYNQNPQNGFTTSVMAYVPEGYVNIPEEAPLD